MLFGVDGEFVEVINATRMHVFIDKKVPFLKMLKRQSKKNSEDNLQSE